MDHGTAEAHRHGIARSNHWPAVEKAHLAKEPNCRCCSPGQSSAVQVHHVFPFHYCIALGRADLELDDRNLVTLCETEHDKPGPNHHLLVGHLDDFRSSNLDVLSDCLTFRGYTADLVKSSGIWQAKHDARLRPLDAMSERDKTAFVSLMNQRMPLK